MDIIIAVIMLEPVWSIPIILVMSECFDITKWALKIAKFSMFIMFADIVIAIATIIVKLT